VLISLIYERHDSKENNDYNWHIAISEDHDPKQAHTYEILTNHYSTTNAITNIKEGELLVSETRKDSLRFYQKLQAHFKVGSK